MPDIPTILAVTAFVTTAAFVQGYAGFGFGIVAITLMALLPGGLAGPAVVVTLCATMVILLLLRLAHAEAPVRWRRVAQLVAGSALGMPLGYAFIHAFGDRPVFRAALGAALVAFAADGLLRGHRALKLPGWCGVPMGVASGFLSGAFVTGGPPVIIYLYGLADDPRDMKATIQAVFVMNLLYRHTAVALAGDYTADVLALAALAGPVAAGALYLGHRLSRRGSVALFRRVVFALIAAAGIGLIGRAVAAMS